MDGTAAEMRAAEIVYEKEHGAHLDFGSIPAEERESILQRIRARVLKIEWFVTHEMLVEKISEKRRYPRRHMRVALGAGLAGAVIIFLALAVVNGVTAFFH